MGVQQSNEIKCNENQMQWNQSINFHVMNMNIWKSKLCLILKRTLILEFENYAFENYSFDNIKKFDGQHLELLDIWTVKG